MDEESVRAVIRRHWDDRADTFDDKASNTLDDAALREAWRERLRPVIGAPPRRVLDLGCGTGALTLLLAELGHEVLGVDVAPRMLGRAREKARARGAHAAFVVGDVEALPVRPESFDVVIERHLFWTVLSPDRALAHWRRRLRAGGELVLIESPWSGRSSGDYRRIEGRLPVFGGMAATSLVELAESLGFRDPRVRDFGGAQLWGPGDAESHYLVRLRKG